MRCSLPRAHRMALYPVSPSPRPGTGPRLEPGIALSRASPAWLSPGDSMALPLVPHLLCVPAESILFRCPPCSAAGLRHRGRGHCETQVASVPRWCPLSIAGSMTGGPCIAPSSPCSSSWGAQFCISLGSSLPLELSLPYNCFFFFFPLKVFLSLVPVKSLKSIILPQVAHISVS